LNLRINKKGSADVYN